MEVRRANLKDMRELLDYIEEYHKTSNLSDVKFVRQDVCKLLEMMFQDRGSLVLIAKHKDKCIGVLAGEVSPFFFNHKQLWATDIMFLSNGAGPTLLRKFKQWAFEMGASRVMMGISSGDSRANRVLELSGGENTGGMYVFYQESR